MILMENKIRAEGKVLPGDVLKVGSFLNQQVDTSFVMELADDIKREFATDKITKVLTIEASGITLAFAAAYKMNVPMVFAKKGNTSNQSSDVYSAEVFSYTHNDHYAATVAKEYLSKDDVVLIVDDVLARGEAMRALINIVEQSGAKVAGCCSAFEKTFQNGGDELRSKGYHVYSLAYIESMSPENGVKFRP